MSKPIEAPLFAHPGWEDSQCARCGSSVVDEVCERCGSEGWLFGDDDAPSTPCPDCDGAGAHHWCASDPEWCQAHPMPGREHTPRGEIEDFLIERFRDSSLSSSVGGNQT